MLRVMGQSTDLLFATANQQVRRVFSAADAAVGAAGTPAFHQAKYALSVMLQGMNVPHNAAGLSQVGHTQAGHKDRGMLGGQHKQQGQCPSGAPRRTAASQVVGCQAPAR